MTKTADDWNPDDPILKSSLAPHETAGVLRMHRAGYKGAELMKILHLVSTKLVNQMQRAMAEGSCDREVSRAGREDPRRGVPGSA